MSTVLWANILIVGKVESDESDKPALYKHARKLDKISKQLSVTHFDQICDVTDMKFQVSNQDLPAGMTSTDALMVKEGVWVSGEKAVDMLEKLILHLSSNNVRFGLFTDQSGEVLSELRESLVFANKAKDRKGQFNFSVVM